LADTARSDSLAQWFTTVSQGNLDRFMPPFIGDLSDQDRWDVVAYALTLHTKPDQIAQGKALFDSNCSNCADKFTNQKIMAALSEDDIIRIIKNGEGDIPAFGKNLKDDQALDVAMYIRTLTFSSTPLTATIIPATVSTEVIPALSATPQSESSNDYTLLKMNQVHVYTDFATQGLVQFIEIYAFTNTSNQTILISSDGMTIPFIKFPKGAQNTGYEPDPNSAQLVTVGKGVAAPPGSNPYAIIAFFTMPYSGQLEIKQPFGINAPSVVLLMPEGINVNGNQLASAGAVVIQKNNYQEFSASDFKAGDVLDFTVNGTPKTTASTNNVPPMIFIGVGALGLILIGASIWFFFRGQKSTPEEDEDEFESADEVMDAILALDDLHRAAKINDEAYQRRRAELKQILKEMM
jgi:mono/diheme cytochrome c family protein